MKVLFATNLKLIDIGVYINIQFISVVVPLFYVFIGWSAECVYPYQVCLASI